MVKTKILGTEYSVEISDLNNPDLDGFSGKCFGYQKKILLRHPQYMFTDNATDEEKQERFKEVLLHELVHAISRETFTHYDDDESLVDWIAQMIPKIVIAYDDILTKLKQEEQDADKD